MEEVHKAKHEAFMPSPGTPSSQHLPMFIRQEAL